MDAFITKHSIPLERSCSAPSLGGSGNEHAGRLSLSICWVTFTSPEERPQPNFSGPCRRCRARWEERRTAFRHQDQFSASVLSSAPIWEGSGGVPETGKRPSAVDFCRECLCRRG